MDTIDESNYFTLYVVANRGFSWSLQWKKKQGLSVFANIGYWFLSTGGSDRVKYKLEIQCKNKELPE